jgi:hypothetical protein
MPWLDPMTTPSDTKDPSINVALFILPSLLHELGNRACCRRWIRVHREVTAFDDAHGHGRSGTDNFLNIMLGDHAIVAARDAQHWSLTIRQEFVRIDLQQRPYA